MSPVIENLYIAPGFSEKSISCEWTKSDGGTITFGFVISSTLSQLVVEVRKRAGTWVECSARGHSDSPKKLNQLLRSGCDVFGLVFSTEEVKRHLTSLPGGISIHVHTRINSIEIPWGLVCLPGNNMKDSNRLFGLKFNIIVQETSIVTAGESDRGWRFVPWLHGREYCASKKILLKKECEFSEIIQNNSFCFVSPDAEEVSYVVVDNDSNRINRFVYVYAHYDTLRLKFNDKDVEFLPQVLIEKDLPEGRGIDIVFINACNTEQIVNEFIQSISQICADNLREVVVIATEVLVPAKFAMRFGLEFIDRLLQNGESVRCIMREMRTKHAPLSVVYALYSLNDFTIEPSIPLMNSDVAEEYRLEIKNINFSGSSLFAVGDYD